MADEHTDPLVALLDKSGLSNAQKRGLWDLYNASKNTDDLVARLDALKLPVEIKRNLFDMKADEGESVTAEPETTKLTEPSEGYWEDRGIAGKVWHPASGVKEGNRADVNILGVPPELAALGAGAVGRAVLKPGLSAAGRIAAGAGAALGEAAPIIGYEAAKSGLKAVGVPEPFASVGAGVASVLTGRFGRKGADAPAATELPPVPKVGIPKSAESPLELTKRLKAENRAAQSTPSNHPLSKSDAATLKKEFETFFQSPSKPKLHAQETAMAMKLLKGGLKSDEVMDAIAELRKMPVSWRNLPTDDEVAAIIRARNAARRP